jgi:hypothetical protein
MNPDQPSDPEITFNRIRVFIDEEEGLLKGGFSGQEAHDLANRYLGHLEQTDHISTCFGRIERLTIPFWVRNLVKGFQVNRELGILGYKSETGIINTIFTNGRICIPLHVDI